MRLISRVTLSAIAGTALSACSLGFFLAPTVPFSASRLPETPDYEQPSSWAASPDLPQTQQALLRPPGYAHPAKPTADVFFVHPTAWMRRDQWNASFEPGPAREIVDEISMATQASVFNACCRIFAPRYRQATLGAFYAPQDEAQKAFSIAYEDVEQAFKVFLRKNHNRPFFIAGHSQGSVHLTRLIAEHVAHTPAQSRFVAAYLPGMGLPMDWYDSTPLKNSGIRPCKTPDSVGCVAAWDTYQEGAKVAGQEPVYYWRGQRLSHLPPTQPRQCTHPISWQHAGAATSAKDHQGAVAMVNTGKTFSFSELLFATAPVGIEIRALTPPRSQFVSASCDGSVLRVPDLKALNYAVMETQPGNYHLLDYELFWEDIRQNTLRRLSPSRG